MRWLGRYLRNITHGKKAPRKVRRTRLELEALEDRSLLSTVGGTISGVAALNESGGITAPLPGIMVTLSGTSNQGLAVNTSVSTDANGAYSFTNVFPGTYNLSSNSGGTFLGGATTPNFTVNAGDTLTQGVSFSGLAPAGISVRMFLSTSSGSGLPPTAAGAGQVSVDRAPVISNAIRVNPLSPTAPSTTLDLAGNFSDPDTTDTMVRFDSSAGPINVQLFDAKAPQTVANFLNYVTSGRYNTSIFHRIETQGILVAQGGGFTFNPNGPSLPAIATDPAVNGEPGISNTQGTLAMALSAGNANSGTDEFFFNVGDNSAALDPQSFTVFGKVVGPADQNVLNNLVSVPTTNEGSPFNEIPLINYNGTKFPTDTTAANYEMVNDVVVVNRGDSLTYSIVSNSNPSLVTATLGTNDPNRLTLQAAAGQTGTATIVVQATDEFGLSVQQSFTVTVI